MCDKWKRANLPKRQVKVVAKSQADRRAQRKRTVKQPVTYINGAWLEVADTNVTEIQRVQNGIGPACREKWH